MARVQLELVGERLLAPLDVYPDALEILRRRPFDQPEIRLPEDREHRRRVARIQVGISQSRSPAVRMHLAGYPREEIASLMGWTEAKTRNLLYRGLADLRERLAQEGIGWDTTEA